MSKKVALVELLISVLFAYVVAYIGHKAYVHLHGTEMYTIVGAYALLELACMYLVVRKTLPEFIKVMR